MRRSDNIENDLTTVENQVENPPLVNEGSALLISFIIAVNDSSIVQNDLEIGEEQISTAIQESRVAETSHNPDSGIIGICRI